MAAAMIAAEPIGSAPAGLAAILLHAPIANGRQRLSNASYAWLRLTDFQETSLCIASETCIVLSSVERMEAYRAEMKITLIEVKRPFIDAIGAYMIIAPAACEYSLCILCKASLVGLYHETLFAVDEIW
ncbi:hypothetical protein N1937_26980 (plasmid) [Rhizobium sp. WSM4643]|uniref:hypothetical protein n=1 Tax=Rhizobium TaxID=379 RepID=UPI001C96CB38|nr:hypothetical protein [Rhizobium leguminosarum]MBY5406727.1 hypothetical protein [Rhizobium leguminosarum]UWM78935.1 hypothetical protein N1937_26980 [Rhizobium leguminosarum bv. viciae]